LKELPKQLPQIDAVMEHVKCPVHAEISRGCAHCKGALKFANKLLDELLQSYTLRQIASLTGICKRNISYMRHRGINTYPMQLALELLAGRRKVITKCK